MIIIIMLKMFVILVWCKLRPVGVGNTGGDLHASFAFNSPN